MANDVAQATGIEAEPYDRLHLDISSGLRNLAVGHVRGFSASRQQMLEAYERLTDLAASWRYCDELSKGFRTDTESRPDSDPLKAKFRERTRRQEQKMVGVLAETADVLAEYARRATERTVLPLPD